MLWPRVRKTPGAVTVSISARVRADEEERSAMDKAEQVVLNRCGDVCRYCGADLSELSGDGRLNHTEWCAIKVGVPDVKIQRQSSPEATAEKQGVRG